MQNLCVRHEVWKGAGALVLFVIIFLVQGSFCGVRADYVGAESEFRSLNRDDQVAIGLGLIATGDFDGLLDYGFTKRLYKAIVAFQSREGFPATGVLQQEAFGRLKDRWYGFGREMGLENVTHPDSGAQLMVPKRLFDISRRTPRGFAFERADEAMALSFVAYPASQKTFAQLYETMALPTAQRRVTYKTLKNAFFVSTGLYHGKKYYTWMNAVDGGSTGFTISWSEQFGETGNRIAMLLANTFLAKPTSAAPGAPPVAVEEPRSPDRQQQQEAPGNSSGTGFKITAQNHILTNNHVAGNCRQLSVVKAGEIPVEAELVASDPTNDLALLKTKSQLAGDVAKFSGGAPPKAGEEIAVYGFPLAGALASSGNIVVGNIAALAGLGNDSRHYQISAPVQPGNSGGPVLNYKGEIVAMVVSKLNAIEAAKVTGDIPQNINFAIKGSVVINFLESNGISFERQDNGVKLDVPDIAEKASAFTFLVECRN
jgi:S1-C subfamily serine protease